jgi:hypothetical protein
MLPDFLVVGAMKAGTTTLKDYLAEVPQIFMPPNEVYFFSDDSYYAQGLQSYERLFHNANYNQVLGERTTTYSYLPSVPERIQKHLPDVKLIWLFREPVARSYSHYWHSAKNGSERLSFEKAIAREGERIQTDFFRGYLKRSRYVEQVRRYLQFFPKENMIFVLFEELIRDPAQLINRILKYLNVEYRISENPIYKHSHATYAPQNVPLQWLACRVFGKTLPFRVVKRLNRRSEPGYPKMSEQLREKLRQEFFEPNQELAELTGLDLSAWNQPVKPPVAVSR